MEVVAKYKYLGVFLDDFLKYRTTANILGESVGRARGMCVGGGGGGGGGIFSRFKHFKMATCMSRLKSCQISMLCQNWRTVQVWGFLGVNTRNTTHALYGTMAWVMPKYMRWISHVRLCNRVVQVENIRLTRHVFNWDST